MSMPRNEAGSEFDPGWEYHALGGPVVERSMSRHLGVTVLSAGELLEECRRAAPDAKELADVEAGIVHAAVERLFPNLTFRTESGSTTASAPRPGGHPG